MKTIAIIGGGAAGLAAAVAAGNAISYAHRHTQEPLEDVEVVIYEADERVGRSILRSGNGRCNLSNAWIRSGGISMPKASRYDEDRYSFPEYHNYDFVFYAYQSLESHDAPYHGKRSAAEEREGTAAQFLFEDLGLLWRQEDDGRLYPLSGKASTVLNLLRNACDKLGVRTECNTRITGVEPFGGKFMLHVSDKRVLHADQVILATGGETAKTILQSIEGLDYHKPVPVLGPLAVKEKDLTRRMDNIRVKCQVILIRKGKEVTKERGEILFRKYGVSGIAIFNLSRYARPGDTLRIRLVGWSNESNLFSQLMRIRKNSNGRLGQQPTCEELLRGVLQEPVADVVLARAKCKPGTIANKDEVSRIAHELIEFDLTVEGIGDEQLAQVHRGGFAVEPDRWASIHEGAGSKRVSSIDMSVPSTPGLRIVGEALDVDGPCGGYNLHWAWSSGMLAGYSAVEDLL